MNGVAAPAINTLNAEGLTIRPHHDHVALNGSSQKALETIFRHPLAHNLEWNHVISLIEHIGSVEYKSNSEVAFEVSGERHRFHKPHTKDLASPELIELRKFLIRAGWSPEAESQAVIDTDPAAPSLLVVVDHHEARLYAIAGSVDDHSTHEINPYDPHHFLHHLAHKDQTREQGQRAPENPAYYEQIAQALATAGQIVVIGHGTGKSNAAHHLAEFLRAHHPETYQRIAGQLLADLSSVTVPELIEMAQQTLRQSQP